MLLFRSFRSSPLQYRIGCGSLAHFYNQKTTPYVTPPDPPLPPHPPYEPFDCPRYAFVIDHKYDLISKIRQQNRAIPQIDPVNGMPSSFARNLLHPWSNHIVSQYATYYYGRATPYFGEFPLQFFASELAELSSESSSPDPERNAETHTIVLYPEQIKITDIEPQHIPHMVRLLMSKNDLWENVLKTNESRVEKMKGITLYFFCDVCTIDRTLTLFQWFDYCFRRSGYTDIQYLFSCGNLKNDQSSTIMIYNGSYRMILSQYMTLQEVDTIVQHMISRV